MTARQVDAIAAILYRDGGHGRVFHTSGTGYGVMRPNWAQRVPARVGFGLRRVAALLLLIGGLTACAPLSQSGMPFAATGASPQKGGAGQTANRVQLASGAVTLVAPSGHCIDPSSLRQEADGGFALLPRCALMRGPSLFGRNRAAVITATLGTAAHSTPPSSAELARSAEGATLLSYNDRGLLPLAKLRWPGHGAMAGAVASADHWRGAFVVNGYLVVLALYAPEGSPLLGTKGADLLTETARRSLAASQPPPAQSPPVQSPAAPAASFATPAATTIPGLRPRPRPGTPDQAAVQKISLRQKIAGLFPPSPTARLAVH